MPDIILHMKEWFVSREDTRAWGVDEQLKTFMPDWLFSSTQSHSTNISSVHCFPISPAKTIYNVQNNISLPMTPQELLLLSPLRIEDSYIDQDKSKIFWNLNQLIRKQNILSYTIPAVMHEQCHLYFVSSQILKWLNLHWPTTEYISTFLHCNS